MMLSGKVALVTGAAQGLGRAYALALSEAGATVVASSRSMGSPEPGGATLAETVRLSVEMGCPVHPAVCDVGSEEQINRTVDETIANFGRIDILVNNAGTYPAHYSTVFSDPMVWTTEIWQKYFAINVIGPYMTMRAVAPHMKAQGSGSIINVSSSAGRMRGLEPDDLAHHNMMGYAASKAALDQLSDYFATELKPWNIAVNAICPGTVITGAWRSVPADVVEAVRNSGTATEATPEVVAPYILHLATQTASGLSGRILSVADYPNWS